MEQQKAEQRRTVVIGSGFGGLGAALELARAGLEPLVLERLSYPGGCASTFSRGGKRFETGATLFSGFATGQLFRTWIDAGLLEVDYELMDPVIDLRGPGLSLLIGRDREAFVRSFLDEARDEDERERLARFFREQGLAAETLWTLIEAPEALPPFEKGGLATQLRLLGRYLRLLPLLGKSLRSRLEGLGLHEHPLLALVADAMGQITLQGSAAEIEAPMAMATFEYPFRGAAHIPGGVGRLADAMVAAIERAGGALRYLSEVRGLESTAGGWRLGLKKGAIESPVVFANLVPGALKALCPETSFRDLDWREAALRKSWSACMHYLVLRDGDELGPEARHLQLVLDDQQPLVEGNNVFVSISGRADGMAGPGERSVTMSTHLALERLRGQDDDEQARIVREVQERMLATLELRAPEIAAAIILGHSASPRTFRRYLSRPHGMVGGMPRLAGLAAYRGLGPCRPAPGLWLVGDSVFPGQSTLATTIGGLKAARDHLRRSR